LHDAASKKQDFLRSSPKSAVFLLPRLGPLDAWCRCPARWVSRGLFPKVRDLWVESPPHLAFSILLLSCLVFLHFFFFAQLLFNFPRRLPGPSKRSILSFSSAARRGDSQPCAPVLHPLRQSVSCNPATTGSIEIASDAVPRQSPFQRGPRVLLSFGFCPSATVQLHSSHSTEIQGNFQRIPSLKRRSFQTRSRPLESLSLSFQLNLTCTHSIAYHSLSPFQNMVSPLLCSVDSLIAGIYSQRRYCSPLCSTFTRYPPPPQETPPPLRKLRCRRPSPLRHAIASPLFLSPLAGLSSLIPQCMHPSSPSGLRILHLLNRPQLPRPGFFLSSSEGSSMILLA